MSPLGALVFLTLFIMWLVAVIPQKVMTKILMWGSVVLIWMFCWPFAFFIDWRQPDYGKEIRKLLDELESRR